MYIDLTEGEESKDEIKREQRYWMKEFSLFVTDRLSLISGDWLTDTIINCAQRLLKEHYPLMGGLQATTLGDILSYTVEKGEFVQILNVRGSHWVTVSNIGCEQNCIKVYDSIPYGDLSSRARKQISALICSDANQIILKFPSVQQQKGGSDCGIVVFLLLHLQQLYVLGLIQWTCSTTKQHFVAIFLSAFKGNFSIHSLVECWQRNVNSKKFVKL